MLAWHLTRVLAGDSAVPPPAAEELMPEKTFAAIVIPDLKKAREQFSAARAGREFSAPELNAFIEPILTAIKNAYVRAATDESSLPRFDDSEQSVLNGEIVACLYDRNTGEEPGVLISVRAARADAFDRVMQEIMVKQLWRNTPLPKNSVFPMDSDNGDVGVIFTGDRLLVCRPLEEMEGFLDRINRTENRARGTLGTSPEFVRARAHARPSAAWIYCAPERVFNFFSSRLEKNTGAEQLSAANSWLSALGMNKGGRMLVNLSFEGAETASELYLDPGEETQKGVIGLLRDAPISSDGLRFVPADSAFVTAGLFDFKGCAQLYTELRKKLYPDKKPEWTEMALLSALSLTFLPCLDTEYVVAQMPKPLSLLQPDASGILAAIRIKDKKKLEEFLSGVSGIAELGNFKIDTVRHRDFTIYRIPGNPSSPAFGIVMEHLLIGGSLDAVRNGIDQLSSDSNILGNTEFLAAMSRISGQPAGAEKLPHAFTYSIDANGSSNFLLLSALTVAFESALVCRAVKYVVRDARPGPDERPRQIAELGSILSGFTDNCWPKEAFFTRQRSPRAAFSMRTERGWFVRGDFPPPLPWFVPPENLTASAIQKEVLQRLGDWLK